MEGLQLHQRCGPDLFFVGDEIGVPGLYGGRSDQFTAELFKLCQRPKKAGECTADGELRDSIFSTGFHDGGNVILPDNFGEVQQVAACFLTFPVGPEHSGVDTDFSDVLHGVGNDVLKGFL